MRRRFAIRTLLITVAVVALIAALLATAGRAGRNRIVVENRSGVAVGELFISVGATSFIFDGLPPGQTAERTIAIRIRGDAHFTVFGRLADGTPLGGDFGYLTGGMQGEAAHFTIEPGGKIDFRQAR